jgi:hypothetical protein
MLRISLVKEPLKLYGEVTPTKIRNSCVSSLLISRFCFSHIGGWDTEQDHFDTMKTSEYAAFRAELKEFLDPSKEVTVYHYVLRKFYGDW